MAADESRVAAPSADSDDFDACVAARSTLLLRFAYLMTGSPEAAEEALQSALAKAFEKWSIVRRMTDRDAYVRRMIVNAHISWRRWILCPCARTDTAKGQTCSLGTQRPSFGAQAQQVLDQIKATRGGVVDCDASDWPPLDDVLLRFHGRDGDADVLARLGESAGRCAGYYPRARRAYVCSANGTSSLGSSTAVGLYVSGGQVGNAISGLFHPTPGCVPSFARQLRGRRGRRPAG